MPLAFFDARYNELLERITDWRLQPKQRFESIKHLRVVFPHPTP